MDINSQYKKEMEQEYNDFREIVLHKNRMLSDHPFLTRIRRHIESNIDTLGEGELFFRARLYLGETETDLYKALSYHNTDYNFPEFPGLAKALNEVGKHYRKAVEWEHDHGFFGFPSSECLSPPIGTQPQGRLNAKYIQSLYAADNPYTAIKEIRPAIGDKVSLATIRLIRDITVADLNFMGLFNLGDEVLSGPLYSLLTGTQSSEKDYIVSQTVASYILTTPIAGKKIEGIKYLSSQNAGGNNYCFFTDEDFESVGSQLYNIQDMLVICECEIASGSDIVNSLAESEKRLEIYKHMKK